MWLLGGLFGGEKEQPASPKKRRSPKRGARGARSPVRENVRTPSPGPFSFMSPAARSVGSAPSTVSSRGEHTHSPTRSSRLRSTGVKLACYLNTECNSGTSTIISLPTECDTLAEVIPKVQARMGLDRRMRYAAEFFLPDGAKITSYAQLIENAAVGTAIIVGCGEPFDHSTVVSRA